MNQSQKVLVAGTGLSGTAAARLVLDRGGEVVLYDGNASLKEEEIKAKFDKEAKVSVVLGEIKRSDLLGVELCIISPGIPLDSPFVAVVDDAKDPNPRGDRAGVPVFPWKAGSHHRHQRQDNNNGPDRGNPQSKI